MKKRLDLPFSVPNIKDIPKLLGVSANVVGHWYAGNTLNGDLLDLTGNGRTLTNSNSPVVSNTNIVSNNNLLQTFTYNGSNQGHYRSHEAWMNMFDADFTASFLVNASSAGTGRDDIFDHGGSSLWVQFNPGTKPSARAGHATAYDVANNLTVLFGGDTSGSPTRNDETWVWNGSNWVQVSPTGGTKPSARMYHAMAYDSARQRIVLFGGSTATGNSQETWEYNAATTTWNLISPAGGVKPSIRNGHVMVYDSVKQRIILFGGTPSNNETWEYDGVTSTWVLIAPTGGVKPSARSVAAMAYDSVFQRSVLFGGNIGGNETWEYNSATITWTLITPTGGTQPAARYDHSMAYDSARQRVVLTGGNTGGDETWEYATATSTWVNGTPATKPTARYYASLSYDSTRQKSVYFGGYIGSTPTQETWEWDGAGFGITIYIDSSTGYIKTILFPPVEVTITGPSTSIRDGYWHVIAVVRSSNLATIYLDGVAGTPVDVTGKGIDASSVLRLGYSSNYYLQGSIAQTLLLNTALTSTQVSKHVNLLKGIFGGRSNTGIPPTFSRNVASYAEIAVSDNKMVQDAPNDPVLNYDGNGLLLQADVAQLCQYTKDFSQSLWSSISTTPTFESKNDVNRFKAFTAIASDSDGSNLIASSEEGFLYISSDYGVTWTKCTSAGQRHWGCVASDADGSNLVAAVGPTKFDYNQSRMHYGYIYTSSDYGVTWTERTTGGYWHCLASDSDGSVLVVGSYTSNLYVSTNSGSTWSVKSALAGAVWGVCCDDDGSVIAVTKSGNYVFVSTDSGVNFSQRTNSGTRSWTGIACSSDGAKIAACVTGGNIYTSTNIGVDWTERASSKTWMAIASDSDGSNLIACHQGGSVYTSADSGASWTEHTTYASYWGRVASDSDGSHLAVACLWDSASIPGPMMLSSDSGATWTLATFPNDYSYVYYYSSVAMVSGGTTLFSSLGSAYGTSQSGDIWKSTNSGATWNKLYAGASYGAASWSCIATKNGTTLVACVGPSSTGTLYTSSDGGATWTGRGAAGSRQWYCVDSDADGSHMVAAPNGTTIYTSSDYGVTWTSRAGAGSRAWTCCALDDTGAKIVVAGTSTNIWTSIDGGANWVERTASGVRNWICLASDADGSNLIAGVNTGYVYTSVDSGANWTVRDIVGATKFWASVASDSAGTTLYACSGGAYNTSPGRIYRSTNAGVNWTDITGDLGTQHWTSLRCDPTGAYVVVAASGGFLATSTNSGTNWTVRELINGTKFIPYGFACDDDMSHILVPAGYGPIFLSTDSGTTFSTIETLPFLGSNAKCVAMDSDGSHMLYVGNSEYIYTSSDSGSTWTKRTAAGIKAWSATAVDEDGSHMVAGVSGGYIYTSTDSGANWTERATSGSRSWRAIASSDNGSVLIAVPSYGYIYTSTNGGSTWTERTAVGQQSWQDVCCDSTGNVFIVIIYGGSAYYSLNTGANLTAIVALGSGNWTGCWMNRANTLRYVCASPAYVWKSTGAITTWTQQTAMGRDMWYDLASDGTNLLAIRSATNGGSDLSYLMDFVGITYANYGTTASISPLVAPDGTSTKYKFVANATNVEHGLSQDITLTAAYYIFEVDVDSGDKTWVRIQDLTIANAYSFFDLVNNVVGTTGAGCTASIYTRSNRRRCAICVLGTAATHTFQISPAVSDGVTTFIGDSLTANIHVWEASCHLGTFQTLPITRTTGAVTRSADSLTYPTTFVPGYKVGNSYQEKKLIVEFRVKSLYTTAQNSGSYKHYFCIGGSSGTASSTRNYLGFYSSSSSVGMNFYNDANDAVERTLVFTTVSDMEQWHTYRLVLDLTNLSNSTFTKDGVAYTTATNMTNSTHNFDTTNCLLRLAQNNAGTVTGYCEIDYVKIWTE